MTVKYNLPRDPSAQLSKIAEIEHLTPVQAIPQLAALDRKATGWIRLALFGAVRLSFAGIFLLSLMATAIWGMQITLEPLAEFVQSYRVNVDWSSLEVLVEAPADIQPLPAWVWAGLLLATGLVLFQSSGVRKALTGHSRWPVLETPSEWVRILLRIFEGAAQLSQLVILGFFALCSMLPLVFLGLNLWYLVGQRWGSPDSFLTLLKGSWEWLAVALAFVGLVIYLLTRKDVRAGITRLLLGLFGGLGLAAMGWAMTQVGIDPVLILIALGLCLVYPIGLAVPLSKVTLLPYFIYRDALFWIIQGITVRQQVSRALSGQVQKNRQRAGDDAWSAVCKTHLLRGETRRAARSYSRQVAYFKCPKCQDDIGLFTGVECRALVLDHAMSEWTIQRGSTLWINALRWLPNYKQEPPPYFDVLVIHNIEEYVVEEFITAYNSSNREAEHKPLNQVDARLSKNMQLEEHELRLLAKNFNQLSGDYDVKETPNPCNTNLRRQAAIQSGARMARQGFGRVVRVSLLLTFLCVLCLGTGLGVQLLVARGILSQGILLVRQFFPETGHAEIFQASPTVTPSLILSPIFTEPQPTGELQVTSTPTVVLQITSPQDGAILIFIPAGSFEMGNPLGDQSSETEDEWPVHQVFISAFFIDRYEVTNGQYQLCVEAGACQPPVTNQSKKQAFYYGKPEFSDYPVIKVSWQAAQDYCAWAGRRLPTEAEWEKAARWNSISGKISLYPWGDQPPEDDLANFAYLAGDTAPVGSYPNGCTVLGVCDLSGNVWEWVADGYDASYYIQSPAQDPPGVSNTPFRVLRGGGWSSTAFELRATERLRYSQTGTRFDVGFRCAKSID